MLLGLSYNIHFGKNIEQILAWLTSLPYSFDIICFQEFPYSQLALIKDIFNPTHYEFNYAASFMLKNEEYGELTVIYKQKAKVAESISLSLGTSIIEQKVLRLKKQRSSLVTKLRYKNKFLLLANTHLVAYASNKRRRDQLTQVITHLKRVSPTSIPTVILGDFNYSSLFWQEKLLLFMEEHGFINSYQANTHKLFLFNHQLDYIFFMNSTILNVEVLHVPFSDHLPIKFTLQI